MASFKLTKRVEAPIDAVFDIFSDIPRADEMIDDIVKIEMLTDDRSAWAHAGGKPA